MTAPSSTRPRHPHKAGNARRGGRPNNAPQNPTTRPANISDGALREAFATLNRYPRTLPESWWDPDVAERMGDWIKAHGATILRKRFGGRK